MSHLRFGVMHFFDERKHGLGSVSGVVTVAGSPAARLVRLHRRDTGMLMEETWSNDQGQYIFNSVALETEVYVIAFDHTGAYDPEAKASLFAELPT